jgi:hypothetical protein
VPKPQNHNGYSCRVNILKYVKVADKWRFAPAQTQNNKTEARLGFGGPRGNLLHRVARERRSAATECQGFERSHGTGEAQGH